MRASRTSSWTWRLTQLVLVFEVIHTLWLWPAHVSRDLFLPAQNLHGRSFGQVRLESGEVHPLVAGDAQAVVIVRVGRVRTLVRRLRIPAALMVERPLHLPAGRTARLAAGRTRPAGQSLMGCVVSDLVPLPVGVPIRPANGAAPRAMLRHGQARASGTEQTATGAGRPARDLHHRMPTRPADLAARVSTVRLRLVEVEATRGEGGLAARAFLHALSMAYDA